MTHAMRLAKQSGIGAVGVFNSSHYGAAFYYSLMAAQKDFIGINFTHADSLLLTYQGQRPYFGTNPICFAAPVSGEEPFCLDMATAITNWNKVKQHRQSGRCFSNGIVADAFGRSTRTPKKACSIFPIGTYKGFGLAMMVEIFCSLLTGMPFGRDITSMYVHPIEKHRFLGQFFMAIDIARFEKVSTFKRRLQQMMDEVRREPRFDRKIPILVAGDPEKNSFKI